MSTYFTRDSKGNLCFTDAGYSWWQDHKDVLDEWPKVALGDNST